MVTIQAQALTKSFDKKVVFQELNFEMPPGAYCIFGSNGRGKSTLLRVLAGSDRDFSGDLKLISVLLSAKDLRKTMGDEVSAGVSIDAKNDPELANRLRSYTPDTPAFYPQVRTHEFLAFIKNIRKGADFAAGIDSFRLDELMHQTLESQSLGQRKRSFFVGTLLPSIPVWILDEPTNGLDSFFQKCFFDWVRAHIERKGTVIIATHDPKVADELKAQRLKLYSHSEEAPVRELQRF